MSRRELLVLRRRFPRPPSPRLWGQLCEGGQQGASTPIGCGRPWRPSQGRRHCEGTDHCGPYGRRWVWPWRLSVARPSGGNGDELEALKRGSDGGASVADGGQAADFAAALKEQTEALKEALSSRGGSNSITTVKTDLVWPTLTDDKSDTKDVVLFYEEFEDVCALANNCRGMSAREKLLALRARCKGSRAKTYTNAYRAAWKTGEVVDNPEAVYLRIKNKHLMFGESREEREVRIDGEHQALVKGRLSGHQFEPLFEASVADLESVGLGKTPRELYLSYLRKMPPHLQKEIRQDKRIWPGDTKDIGLRSPQTWEECHKVVLEYEQREAAHRAVAHSTTPRRRGSLRTLLRPLRRRRRRSGSSRPLRPGLLARRPRTAPWRPAPAPRVAERERRASFHFRDHGNCPKGDSCPFSHDKELRKQALAAKRGESTLAAKGGKGGGKGGGKAGATAKAKPIRLSRRRRLRPRRSLLARCARSFRRRVRAGRARTVTWFTVCSPGRVMPCQLTGALPRERP